MTDIFLNIIMIFISFILSIFILKHYNQYKIEEIEVFLTKDNFIERLKFFFFPLKTFYFSFFSISLFSFFVLENLRMVILVSSLIFFIVSLISFWFLWLFKAKKEELSYFDIKLTKDKNRNKWIMKDIFKYIVIPYSIYLWIIIFSYLNNNTLHIYKFILDHENNLSLFIYFYIFLMPFLISIFKIDWEFKLIPDRHIIWLLSFWFLWILLSYFIKPELYSTLIINIPFVLLFALFIITILNLFQIIISKLKEWFNFYNYIWFQDPIIIFLTTVFFWSFGYVVFIIVNLYNFSLRIISDEKKEKETIWLFKNYPIIINTFLVLMLIIQVITYF